MIYVPPTVFDKRTDSSQRLARKFNKTFYTTGAYENYLARFRQEGLDYASRIVKMLKPKPSWRFLDVGCGLGGIILGLRKLGFQAWGTEISPYCLKVSPARKWIKSFPITALPLANQSLEVVICIDVLCYLTKQELGQAIKESTRVAKDYLYIETICQGSPNSLQKYNPDPLRKNESILGEDQLRKLFAANKALFVKSLFRPGEEVNLGAAGVIKKIDFNGFFVKEDAYLASLKNNS